MRPTSVLSCLGTAAPAVLFPFLLSTLCAQTSDHLLGITRNAPFLRHVDDQNCAVLGQCAVPGMPPSTPLPPYVGGTAWDPVRSGAWVTNGLLLAKVDDNCVVQCPPNAIPTLAANAFVTGLEVVVGRNELWMIDNLGNLHRYTNACPPVPIGGCNTGLGLGAVMSATTGLAVDEARGIVFLAYPDFATGVNTIVVRTMAAPCAPLSQFVLPSCAAGFGTVLGLACDWGKHVLYATDGLHTLVVSYTWVPPNVVPLQPTCCGSLGADPLIGLAIRPGRATSVGTPCANAPCPLCPMNHSLGNDPSLGNAAFRLDLDGAPANSFAWCMIGQGPCLVPGVVALPFCGPIHTIPYLGALGANATGGAGVCDGATSFNLSLPVSLGLAGSVFSSQCLVLCFGGGVFGFSQSNCLSWELQGL
ncbi:MAG TPA: hypothetical protein VFZ65_09505 [Planctomycetota bacterium]|nr:hypothetical protein [Planctomycetota bacterium]